MKTTFTKIELLIAKIIWIIFFPLLLVSIYLCIHFEGSLDQIEMAFVYGIKYTFIPFFVLFFVILYLTLKDFKKVLLQSFIYSICYTICAIYLVLPINSQLGRHTDYEISGVVVDKKPGRGSKENGLAPVTIQTKDQEIKIRIVRIKWKELVVGEQVTIKAKKGSFGLLYK